MATDVGKSATLPRLRYRVLQAGVWVIVGFALDKLIALVQVVVLARLLAPADFGLMAVSAAVLLMLLTVSELGLDQALIARAEIHDDDLAVAWTLSFIRAGALACSLWIFADLIARFMQAQELGTLLRVHALGLLIQGVQSPALAQLLRKLELKRRVTMDVVRRVIETSVTIGLAVWLQSFWALVGGQLVGFAVGSVLSYVIAPFRPRLALRGPSLQYFLGFGKHVNVTTILIVAVVSGGEFVVGRMLGTEELGLYQMAMLIPSLIGVRATVVIGQVSLPAYAILRADTEGVVKAFALQMRMVGLLLLPAAVGVAVLAPVLVPVLFGPRWLATVEPLRVLCLYAMCACLSGVMASLHYGLSRPDIPARIAFVQFAVYTAVIVPLTFGFGLVGAAGALALTYGVGVALSTVYTVQLMGSAARAVFFTLASMVLVAGIIGFGMMHILPGIRLTASNLFLIGIGMATAYAGYLWRVEYPKLVGLWRGEVR